MRTREPMDGLDPVDGVDTQIVAPLRDAALSLDELHRARLCAAIEAGLDRLPLGARPGWRGHAPPRATWRTAAAVAAAASAAVAGAVLIFGVPLPGRRAAPSTAATRDLLAPYLYAGAGIERAVLDPSSRLSVPAGARVRAAIGTRVRMTLVGPGALSMVNAEIAGDLELQLDAGALFVDYDGSAGGTLKVRSPGAVTTVLGTLFSVEAQGGSTRVAVARGHIRTDARTDAGYTTRRLASGTSWTARGGGPVQPISPELAAALGEHDASPPPPVGEYGLVRVDGSGAATGTAPLTLDGRPLAAAPLVARIPAGSHLVVGEGQSFTVEIASGAKVRLDTSTMGHPSAAPPAGVRPTAHALSHARWQRPAVRHLQATPTLAPDGAPPAAATVDLESVYAAAEADMRAGRRDRARDGLREIVARDARGPRAEAALLDLARLALADGNPGDAQRYLSRLPERLDDPALLEPADHLRCSTNLKLGDVAAARRCLAAFRRHHPRSLHDAEALALLAADAGGDCGQARPLLDEYLRRYPRGPFAAHARARRAACCPSPACE